MLTLRDLLLGGPGLDGYAYNADVYCVECGQSIISEKYTEPVADVLASDSECWPQPIFFGESDCPQHCAECGEYLYGTAEEEPDDDDEPQEGDYTTTDHVRFYQHGKLVLTIGEDDDVGEALRSHMEREQFFPDAWFISDHGNAHRIDLS